MRDYCLELKLKLTEIKERVSTEINLVSKIISIVVLVFIIIDTAIPDYDFGNHNIFNETYLKINFNLKNEEGIKLLLFVIDKIKIHYNEGEFKLLQKNSYRQKIASSIYNGVENYLKSK